MYKVYPMPLCPRLMELTTDRSQNVSDAQDIHTNTLPHPPTPPYPTQPRPTHPHTPIHPELIYPMPLCPRLMELATDRSQNVTNAQDIHTHPHIHPHPHTPIHPELIYPLPLFYRLMELARDRSQNVIEAQDTRSVLEAVSANPYGRDMAVTFLKLHFHELTN